MSADFEQVMAQCSRGCFTGLLRVRTREGNGEVRFLSGIQDGIRFDSMEGDAALERLLSASDPEFEAISSLPPIDFASTEPVPPEGGLDRYHAAQLMRYCESNSLTCALELEVGGRVLTARYRLGELLSVEPDSEHTARLAEAKEGLYRFKLPRFELPANVQQRRSVPAARAAAGPAKGSPPVTPKPAPTPVAARPAPAAAAKPAPTPVAARPAPAAAKPTPASLAETPIVAMKPVAIVTPPAAPIAAKAAPPLAKPPASPSPASSQPGVPASPKVAAAGTGRAAEARPAPSPARAPAVPPVGSVAATARREGPRLGPSAITPQPGRPAAQPGGTAHPAPPAAHASSASPTSRPPAPRSPVPAVPPSVLPPAAPMAQAKPAQLQGLWADAVKPPPQSAPLEFDGSVRVAAASGAHNPVGRAEGLSSIAYTPPQAPPAAIPRARSSAGYWLVAVALLIAVAAVGWFTFGPP